MFLEKKRKSLNKRWLIIIAVLSVTSWLTFILKEEMYLALTTQEQHLIIDTQLMVLYPRYFSCYLHVTNC